MNDQNSEQAGQIPQRLLKYLPFMMIGHLLITVPTFFISIALAYATFVQADATRKIQRSETWPYVSFSTSNSTPEGEPEISLSLRNNGVGPASLEATELIYKGKPMPSPREFLRQCCAGESKFSFMTEPVTGVLRPAQQANFIRLLRTDENTAIWDRLDKERWNIIIRSCYCSIFGDCWISDNRQKRPKPVESCPADWSTFDDRPFAGTSGASEAGF